MTEDELRTRLIVDERTMSDLTRWGLAAQGWVVLLHVGSTSEAIHFTINARVQESLRGIGETLKVIFPTMSTDWSIIPITHQITGNDRVLFELLEKA